MNSHFFGMPTPESPGLLPKPQHEYENCWIPIPNIPIVTKYCYGYFGKKLIVSEENKIDNESSAKLKTTRRKDSQTISIQPFDKGLINDIEQAIIESNLGFNPSNNGERVIINVPPLTEERRRELVKQVKSEIENSKVSIRSIRQKANDEMKLLSKSGLSEDLLRDAENSVQKLTDSFVVKIDEIFKSKESDIMKV